MDKKTRLKDLLKRLDSLEESLPIGETKSYLDSLLEKGTKEFQKSFKEDPTVKYLDEFNGKLEKFKKDFNLEPVISEIESIQEQIAQMQESFTGQFDENTKTSELTKAELTNLIQSSKGELEGMTRKEISALLKKVSALEEELSFQDSNSKMQGQSLKQVISGYEKKIEDLTSKFKEMGMSHSAMMSGMDSKMEVQDVVIKEISADLDKFRKDFIFRISNIGGGSMNRNIAIGGNTSVLSRYTDVNIKPGSGITFAYSNNNTTKYLDLTITATAGAGGITREVNTITVSSTIGATSAIDYVTLANGGIKVTLPTAVSNTNLYTIKNIGSSSVLVATTGGETIDGDTTKIMPVQYTSIDLISDNSNWKIT